MPGHMPACSCLPTLHLHAPHIAPQAQPAQLQAAGRHAARLAALTDAEVVGGPFEG